MVAYKKGMYVWVRSQEEPEIACVLEAQPPEEGLLQYKVVTLGLQEKHGYWVQGSELRPFWLQAGDVLWPPPASPNGTRRKFELSRLWRQREDVQGINVGGVADSIPIERLAKMSFPALNLWARLPHLLPGEIACDETAIEWE